MIQKILLISSGIKRMIQVKIKEYREGDYAVRTTEVTFFRITLFKCKKTTTNNQAVKLLTSEQQHNNIKGFA